MFGVILGFHSSLPKVTYVLVLTCSILGYFLALRIPSSCYWILLILAGALLAQPIKIHGGMLENYTKVDLCFYVEEVKGSSDEGYKARILSEEGRFYLYSNIPIYPGEVMQVRTELRPVSSGAKSKIVLLPHLSQRAGAQRHRRLELRLAGD